MSREGVVVLGGGVFGRCGCCAPAENKQLLTLSLYRASVIKLFVFGGLALLGV